MLGTKSGHLRGSEREVCEFGGALDGRVPFHESTSLEVRGTGILKSVFQATVTYVRAPLSALCPRGDRQPGPEAWSALARLSAHRPVLGTVPVPAHPAPKPLPHLCRPALHGPLN